MHTLKVYGPGKLPTKAYEGDVGYDLYTHKTVVIYSGDVMVVDTGIAIQPPPGYWGMVVGRSSSLPTAKIHVGTGIIDPGYRGSLGLQVLYLGTGTIEIPARTKLAQYILIPAAPHFQIEETDHLDPSERGEGGFGSSGQ